MEILHRDVILVRVETNLKHLHWPGAPPGDSHNAVLYLVRDRPFLDSNGHGRLIDGRRLKVFCQLWDTLLKRSRGVLAHLRSRFHFLFNEGDFVHPFNRGAAVPTRYHETDRGAMIFRQRLAVQLGREKPPPFRVARGKMPNSRRGWRFAIRWHSDRNRRSRRAPFRILLWLCPGFLKRGRLPTLPR